MDNITARAETELKLDDAYLEANYNDPTVVIDIAARTPLAAFIPACHTVPATHNGVFQIRGFHIDCARDNLGANDETATTGYLNRCLKNHQAGQNIRSKFVCGVDHPESVRKVYPYLTTARGISLYC